MVTRRDVLQIISGLCLIVGIIFCFVVPIVYVAAACLLALVIAIISIIRQRAPLQKRHRVTGIAEIILSIVLLSLAMGVAAYYALQALSS